MKRVLGYMEKIEVSWRNGSTALVQVQRGLAAAERVHADLGLVRRHTVPAPEVPAAAAAGDVWRQLDSMYEHEAAFEELIDHPSVFGKVA